MANSPARGIEPPSRGEGTPTGPPQTQGMKRHTVFVLTACAGALAYAGGKFDLAMRGELGMPGIPPPPEQYEQYDPYTGQLGNAAMGLGMAVVIALLLRPPFRNRWPRWGLLAVSWVGALVVTSGVGGLILRAMGVVPGIEPGTLGAEGYLSLTVGVVWAAAWIAASVTGFRRSPGTARRGVALEPEPGLPG